MLPLFPTPPQITEENVRAALKTMVFANSEQTTQPLESLYLVEVRLNDFPHPRTPHMRRYVLQSVLTNVITEALCDHRKVLELTLPGPGDVYKAAMAQIEQDALTGNYELISWSCLYYRYVRVDLDIKPRQLTEKILTGDRMLRRYQQHGIRRLTERLIDLEYKARRLFG